MIEDTGLNPSFKAIDLQKWTRQKFVWQIITHLTLLSVRIPNLKINIVTKFQVSNFKNDEVRGGGGKISPPNA